MDEGLVRKEERGRRWGEILEEMKRLCYLAGPMVAVTLSFFLLNVISLMMVGHLGELPLSSTAIAISFAGVTGFSVLVCHSPSPSVFYTSMIANLMLCGIFFNLVDFVF